MSVYSIVAGEASGRVIHTSVPLSFWGGVDPGTGTIIDVHHPLNGQSIAGAVLVMPGTRGSCTGSGVMLDMILSDKAPAALVFVDEEDVATLGVIVGAELFDRSVPVLRVSPDVFSKLEHTAHAEVSTGRLSLDGQSLPVVLLDHAELVLSPFDLACLDGQFGPASRAAMRIICTIARLQGARSLIDVTRGHIDGCIYASPANLTFAERFAEMGGKVCIPTTMNAISVDHRSWRKQGTPPSFGLPAQKLADAYVRMGCQPTFTCSPYLLDYAPKEDERIAWAESNAVIFANTVLGARTAKHPDFLDLCIALTGRSPLSGVYLDEHRQARRILDVEVPAHVDDAFWPLLGYVAGRLSPDRIPVLRGVADAKPGQEEMKALCAAFGTTSSAPMLHIEGITPEAGSISPIADRMTLSTAEMLEGWDILNSGPEDVQLVALGSPHASLRECHEFVKALKGRKTTVPTIITAGRNVVDLASNDGTLAALTAAEVQVLSDLCWCSISEPLFPPGTRAVMTNSGKYAHYGPGLSGRPVRFGSISACAEASTSGLAKKSRPAWLDKV